MVFNSIEFAIFLPVVLSLHWLVFNRNLRCQNLFIIIVSYIFYGWWDWRFLSLIAFTSLCTWTSGLLIRKYRDERKVSEAVSAANIVVNLAILCVFKYYDFFVSSFAGVFLGGRSDGLLLNVILPVGISFYTFQALSYSIDVYRQKIEPTEDIIEFFAFVSFFPQLVAGPIGRATTLLPQFREQRRFDYSLAADGCKQILWGLFKKVVIADRCAVFVGDVFSTYQTQAGSTLLLGIIFFTFQIYCDFSGYSDISIGTAKLFGIKLMRNFNYPYFSRDIAEFWRRWHISLTTWFRDYIYIPLGGSRCSKWKIVRNTFIIFLVSGLWHGANWTFIVWGAYHAALFLPLILLGKNKKYKDVVASGRALPNLKETCQILLTFMLAALGWLIFRAESMAQVWNYLCGMLHFGTFNASYRFFLLWPLSAPICFMLLAEWVSRSQEHPLQNIKLKPVLRWVLYFILATSVWWFYSDASGFIYQQF